MKPAFAPKVIDRYFKNEKCNIFYNQKYSKSYGAPNFHVQCFIYPFNGTLIIFLFNGTMTNIKYKMIILRILLYLAKQKPLWDCGTIVK